MGSCGGSTYIALHRTWLVSSFLPGAVGAPVGVFCFTVRLSARIHGDHLVSFTDSCASPPYGVVPWTFAWRVAGWASCPPPRYSRTLSFALTYGHDSRVLMTTAIDIVWRWPCLPRCGGSDPLLLRYAWWSSQCLEAGLTSRPLLALPGLCLMPDL